MVHRPRSNIRRHIVVLGVLFGLLATACGSAATETADTASTASAEATQSGPALSGEFDTVSGETVDLANYEGQDVVLWFWAPW